MASENISSFIRAIEHSSSLREEFYNCNDDNELLTLAKKYGFSLNSDDLKENPSGDRLEKWFNESKISPIKKEISY